MPLNLKRALSDGLVLVGTWLNTRSEDQAEIIGHAGFDFVIGFDLSNALGVGGQLEHPLLLDTIGDIVRRVRARGCAVGIWMPDPAMVGPWIDRGVQFVTVANSDKIFLEACRNYSEAVRARIPPQARAQKGTGIGGEV